MKNITPKLYKLLCKMNRKFFPKYNLFLTTYFYNYLSAKKSSFEENNQIIETVAVRGSTSDYAFYSPCWENSFNFGLTSTDLHQTYHLCSYIKDKCPNLKRIIVFGSVFLPGYNLIYTSERYRAYWYKYFFSIPFSCTSKISKKNCREIKKFIIDQKLNQTTKSEQGFITKKQFNNTIDVSVRVAKHLRENIRIPSQIIWLEKLVTEMENIGIKMILVLPPYRSDYKSFLKSSDPFVQIKNCFTERNIIDLFNDPDFTDDDFGDSDHLNDTGAIKATKIIKNIILSQ